MWPKAPPDDEEDLDDVENSRNQRFMRLGLYIPMLVGLFFLRWIDMVGDDMSSIASSDAGSETSGDGANSSDEETDSQYDGQSLSALSNILAPSDTHTFSDDAEKEFRAEVKQSLDRAFYEDHSVDNAAVELKTLRMASNVSLTRVREAVIAAIVEKYRSWIQVLFNRGSRLSP